MNTIASAFQHSPVFLLSVSYGLVVQRVWCRPEMRCDNQRLITPEFHNTFQPTFGPRNIAKLC